MKYIIVTRNAKFIVSEAEKEDFLFRFQESKTPLLRLGNQLVDRFGIEIFELPFFIKSEAENLKVKGLRRCKYCGEIINRIDKCACSDNKKLRGNNPYSLEEPKKIISLPPSTM